MGDNPLFVVAGFGRCGSSACMQMLDAGGVPIYPGNGDACQEDGYELPENVGIYRENGLDWMADGAGQAVKLLFTLKNPLPSLPLDLDAKWLVMLRDSAEQAKSMEKLVYALQIAEPTATSLDVIKFLLEDARGKFLTWLEEEGAIFAPLSFEQMIAEPLEFAAQLAALVDPVPMDVKAAAAVIVERSSDCYDGYLAKDFAGQLVVN